MQEELTLREQKRIDTRLRIENSATKLVDERGFGAVTVEEICADAGISRRTFFNYFDSKDAAILGGPSSDFTDEQRDQFLSEPTDSLLKLTIELLKSHMDGHDRSPAVAERRQRIASDPDAALAASVRKRAKAAELTALIEDRLRAEPQLRTLCGSDPATEAMLISGFARETLWLGLSSPDIDYTLPLDKRIDAAFALVTEFTKGF